MILFHSTESFFVLRDHGPVSLGASHNSVKTKFWYVSANSHPQVDYWPKRTSFFFT